MKVVTLPLQWDSMDEKVFEKEVVYITKNNCKYVICKFGSIRFMCCLLIRK